MRLQAAFKDSGFLFMKNKSNDSGWVACLGVRQLLFLLASRFVSGNRQFKDNLQAVWQYIFGRDAALVLLYDMFGNGQAQACAIASAAAVCSKERCKDVW